MSSAIQIRSDQHGIIIGGTGDGKTTLLMEKIAPSILRKSRQKLIVLNPGAEPRYYEELGQPTQMIDTSWPKAQHITPHVYKDLRKYGIYFTEILKQGNVLTVIDELAMMGTGTQYASSMKYLWQMGRRRNCGTWAITQRPRAIPIFTVNQASHIFVGDVLGTDLQYLENVTSQPWRSIIQQRKQYEFLYWSRLTKEPPRVVRL